MIPSSNKIQICPLVECTGCAACQNACPHKCIKMRENEFGELHPIIDEEKCKMCNMCINVCPVNSPPKYNNPIVCYAAWITNKDKRRICASGGIATIMSEFIINKYKGVVFGSRYDSHMSPIITFANSINDVEKFKGSRYVQNVVGGETYREVKNFLKERKVLYIGTPCQVAGLKNFLHTEYNNLITCDLICHGCSPTAYFLNEVEYRKNKNKLKDITDVRFRGNDDKNYCFSFWSGDKCLYEERSLGSYYLYGFFKGITLRENCYVCAYARPDRISDITIGDFIGLGRKEPFKYSKKNVSVVLINTDKGGEFYNELSENSPELINVKRAYSERLEYEGSLKKACTMNPLHHTFREIYVEKGYYEASRCVMKRLVGKEKVKNLMKSPKRILGKVYRYFFS